MLRPRVSRTRTPSGWIEFARAPLPPALVGIVAGRCGNAEHASSEVSRTIPASTVVPLAISWGDEQDVTEGSAVEGAGPHGSFVAGVRAAPTRTRFRGEQGCVQVYLTPLAARRILGVPGHELAQRVLSLDDVAPTLAGLADRLAETPTWAERLALVDRELVRLSEVHDARGDAPIDVLAEQVWHELACSHGTTPVRELAARTGWSPRSVTARFSTAVGLPPKAAARLLRFEHAARSVGLGRGLAEVAATTGYADQSHLTREFVALAGITPGMWAATPPPSPRAAWSG